MRQTLSILVSLCASVASADVVCAPGKMAIPDGTSSAARSIVVPASSSVIVGMTVSVNVTHPWVGDLQLVLIHPNGTQVVFVDRPGIPSVGFPGPWGCGGSNIAATFDDAALIDAESACSTTADPVLTGALKPLQALSALNGLAAQGTWTLVASDLASVDAGTLGDVCLNLTVQSACSADIDGNGVVDAGDLAILLGAWGRCADCSADLDHNGTVNGADLAILLGAWGNCS